MESNITVAGNVGAVFGTGEGRSLAVAEALIFSDGDREPVARCSMTYSIPPKRPENRTV